jgi:tRNA threonylcarbamoyladenosine biosynthesis protein TsaB
VGSARDALVLAVESATETASAALVRADGEVVALRAAPPGRPASETLLPTILALLAERGLRPGDLDAFAVSIGPGSFTGLRVGVATVKGLAFGGGRVVPVPTLEALAAKAAAAAGGPPVVATLDARRGELYAAGYVDPPERGAPAWGPAVLTPPEVAARLASAGGAWIVAGEGAALLRPLVAGSARWVEGAAGVPDAGWVGRLGARRLSAGGGVPAAALAPFYARRAEAEVRRTGMRFEADGAAGGSAGTGTGRNPSGGPGSL